ncbi:hypothetical protein Pmani_005775 [Petrolisthes manimaculis]|uniref:Methyltransferase-like protein 5 n=1 Tax=Petrolisthes manimaculis TaxID=1843537 RepID=A0AAE1QBS0_9EUCA|nr:hypothetical protein Pmani_005775 [Petrolisthes manimaculis]
MKLKELESWLQDVQGFSTPRILLEQYQTPPHIAARVLHTAQASFKDLEGKMVADLGCGCGMLMLGASLLEAAHVIGVDIDEGALEVCQENLTEAEVDNVELIKADVTRMMKDQPRFHKFFDTVLLNPPFGTKHNPGTDVAFLQTALEISHGAVYSLHKTSTRTHIVKKAGDWGVKAEVLAKLRYDLPNTYKFHKKASVDIDVDFIRFSRQK